MYQYCRCTEFDREVGQGKRALGDMWITHGFESRHCYEKHRSLFGDKKLIYLGILNLRRRIFFCRVHCVTLIQQAF